MPSDATTVATVAVLGVVVLLWCRGDYAAYSLASVGVFRRVSRSRANAVGDGCAELHCEVPVEGGERRRWYKELVVAGVVIVRYGGGVSVYCAEHVSFEFRHSWTPDDPSAAHQLHTTLVEGFVDVLEWRSRRNVQRSHVSGVAAATGSVARLFPLLFIVLVASAALRVFGGRRSE